MNDLFSELLRLLRDGGFEVRIETFKNPPESAGGFCKIHGKNLVLLSRAATRPEQTQALIEVVETIGLAALNKAGTDLSPALLARLNQRGHMTWPHRTQAPSIKKS